ncbi:MAG TPA: hypothetical protein VFQ41_07585 [Candidatus Angelobacter sp.]|nr:hypothetical protein [Candidatus Angelobacter sp.]
MPSTAVKKAFLGILSENKHLGTAELRRQYSNAFLQFQEEHDDWSTEDKGKPWSDDELRVVLSDAPTTDNALKHARAFKRGIGGVKQIYRWALQPVEVIDEKRPDHKFVQQVRRISKELGWLS